MQLRNRNTADVEIVTDTSTVNQWGHHTQYIKEKVLGKGAFAKCYQVAQFGTNERFCLKMIDQEFVDKHNPRSNYIRLKSEVEIQMSLNHPNIVKLHHFFETKTHACLLLQVCNGGTIQDALMKERRFEEPHAFHYASQLANALKYLQDNLILHRDLKLTNFLLDDNDNLLIADFGLCTRLDYFDQTKNTICGTPNYLAPEVLDAVGHSLQVDVWSYGVALFAMLTGHYPFMGSDKQSVTQTYARIRSNQWSFTEQQKKRISPEARQLITDILQLDPKKRITLDGVLRSAWFMKMKMNIHYNPTRQRCLSENLSKFTRSLSQPRQRKAVDENNNSHAPPNAIVPAQAAAPAVQQSTAVVPTDGRRSLNALASNARTSANRRRTLSVDPHAKNAEKDKAEDKGDDRKAEEKKTEDWRGESKKPERKTEDWRDDIRRPEEKKEEKNDRNSLRPMSIYETAPSPLCAFQKQTGVSQQVKKAVEAVEKIAVIYRNPSKIEVTKPSPLPTHPAPPLAAIQEEPSKQRPRNIASEETAPGLTPSLSRNPSPAPLNHRGLPPAKPILTRNSTLPVNARPPPTIPMPVPSQRPLPRTFTPHRESPKSSRVPRVAQRSPPPLPQLHPSPSKEPVNKTRSRNPSPVVNILRRRSSLPSPPPSPAPSPPPPPSLHIPTNFRLIPNSFPKDKDWTTQERNALRHFLQSHIHIQEQGNRNQSQTRQYEIRISPKALETLDKSLRSPSAIQYAVLPRLWVAVALSNDSSLALDLNFLSSKHSHRAIIAADKDKTRTHFFRIFSSNFDSWISKGIYLQEEKLLDQSDDRNEVISTLTGISSQLLKPLLGSPSGLKTPSKRFVSSLPRLCSQGDGIDTIVGYIENPIRKVRFFNYPFDGFYVEFKNRNYQLSIPQYGIDIFAVYSRNLLVIHRLCAFVVMRKEEGLKDSIVQWLLSSLSTEIIQNGLHDWLLS